MAPATLRLEAVRSRIAEACVRAGRDPSQVQLVAASKYADAAGVKALAEAGQRVFGENRVQDALAKIQALAGEAEPAELEWHLIGHLQSNKAKQAADGFAMVESVDSLPLAQTLSARAQAAGRVLPVLLQVNVDEDPAKHGFYTDHLVGVYASIAALDGISVEGLMTIGASPGKRG